MNKPYPFTELQAKLSQSQKIFLAFPANPTFDQAAAGLSFFLSLKDAGKTVSVVCPTPMTVEFNHLVGVDQVTDKVKGTDLVVNFDYLMEQIEKVSYNDEDGKLNLVVQPKTGAPPLTDRMVNFSYSGITADLVFSFGIKDPTAIDFGNKVDFANLTVVNVDNGLNPTALGELSLFDNQAGSLSEIILGVILGAGLPFNQDIAQNVLAGIWKVTRGLSAGILSADTYEAVAVCLRAGAQKPAESMPRPDSFPPRQAEQFKPRPKTWQRPEEKKPVIPVQESQPQVKQNPPADWFEPKIYRGSNIS